MSIERTELGIWLLVPEPVAPVKRKRAKKAKHNAGQFSLADAIRKAMTPAVADWVI